MRFVLFALLAIVAVAAAVLSFDALRSLALLAAFAPALAWLLPVVVDAGAASGSLVWLSRPGGRAEAFGRALALTLLGSSVAGNAVSHGLAAYGLRPPWWLVVLVSGIAPAVLGAVVHLAVLVGSAPNSGRPTGAPTGAQNAGPTGARTTAPTGKPTALPTGDQPNDHDAPTTEMPDALDPSTEATGRRFDADSDFDGERPITAPTGDESPDRPGLTDDAIAADAREWAVDLRRPPTRDEMLTRYRIGAGRCRRIRERLGWTDEPTAGREEPTAGRNLPTADPNGAPE